MTSVNDVDPVADADNPTDTDPPATGSGASQDPHDNLARAMSLLDMLGDDDRRQTLQHLQHLVGTDFPSTTPRSSRPRNTNVQTGRLSDPSNQTVVIVDKFAPRLRKFSGKYPVPSGEVGFSAYYDSVRSYLDDPDCDERLLKRAILDSLNEPASSASQNIRSKTAENILELLSSLYKPVEDTEELMINFTSHMQTSHEKSSDYLKCLYNELNHIASLKSMGVREFDQCLCKQFQRGCNDETLLLKLNLDVITMSSLDMITKVRTIEARQLEKKLRLKGDIKSTAKIQQVSTPIDIEHRLGRLEQQLSTPVQQSSTSVQHLSIPPCQGEQMNTFVSQQPYSPSAVNTLSAHVPQTSQTVNMFCYRCGLSGHLAVDCMNPPNRQLVDYMINEHRRRRQCNKQSQNNKTQKNLRQ